MRPSAQPDYARPGSGANVRYPGAAQLPVSAMARSQKTRPDRLADRAPGERALDKVRPRRAAMKVTNVPIEDLNTIATEVGVELLAIREKPPQFLSSREVEFNLRPLDDRYRIWTPVSPGRSRPTEDVCGHGWYHFARRLFAYYHPRAKLYDGTTRLKPENVEGGIKLFEVMTYLNSRFGLSCLCDEGENYPKRVERALGDFAWEDAERKRSGEVRAFFDQQRRPRRRSDDVRRLPRIAGPLLPEDDVHDDDSEDDVYDDDDDDEDDDDEGKPTPEENRMRRYDEIERKAWPRSSARKHADNDEHEFGVEAEEGEASKLRTHHHVWEYASGGSPRRTIAIFDERSSAERYADEHVAAFEDPYVARGDARSGYSITSTVSDCKADLGAIRIEACESDGCTPDV